MDLVNPEEQCFTQGRGWALIETPCPGLRRDIVSDRLGAKRSRTTLEGGWKPHEPPVEEWKSHQSHHRLFNAV